MKLFQHPKHFLFGLIMGGVAAYTGYTLDVAPSGSPWAFPLFMTTMLCTLLSLFLMAYGVFEDIISVPEGFPPHLKQAYILCKTQEVALDLHYDPIGGWWAILTWVDKEYETGSHHDLNLVLEEINQQVLKHL